MIRMKKDSIETYEKLLYFEDTKIGSQETSTASVVDESQQTTANNIRNLIDLSLTIHTTQIVNIVRILDFEINVPQEGSQWSRYRKNVMRSKIKANYQISCNDGNTANTMKSKSLENKECVQTRERPWGLSTINLIATVDQNSKKTIDKNFY